MNTPTPTVSRRDFLAASSLAAGALAFPSIASAQHKADR
ncbi:MAG: twin-arginine translocation signal domain-containing protein, partial [Proteobacteria bacterium]|nr:twin-arginine translocation signal domain-containing protein [Pseudomonadota bacterium]